MTIDPEFLKILACPACDSRPPVRLDQHELNLICSICGRSYPIQNGSPIMLVEKPQNNQKEL